jgi:hypothetical protein
MPMRRPITRAAALALLGLALLLAVSGSLERAINACGLEAVAHRNAHYLEEALAQSLKTFAVLSSLKVGLAVVEGTEVGVGFGLEIGDIVQAAYDFVDIAWRTVMGAGIILVGTRFLLEAARLVDGWLLTLALAGLLLTLPVRWWLPRCAGLHQTLRDASLLLAILTAAFYVVLPLSVSGGAIFSARITAPVLTEAESGLEALRSELFPEEAAGEKGLWDRWGDARKQVDRLAATIREKTTALMVLGLKLIAGYLFDCIVFPLSLFIFLLWATRLIARHLFGLQKRRELQDDLEAVLHKVGLTKIPPPPGAPVTAPGGGGSPKREATCQNATG